MANTPRNFSDNVVTCRKCFAPLAEERLDRQVLIVGSIALFNFARFACLHCEAVNSWQSPNLLPDKTDREMSFDARFPNRLEDTPKPSKAILGRLGVKGVSRTKTGKYKVRAVVNGETKYLGCYDSIQAASRVYERVQQANEQQNAQIP